MRKFKGDELLIATHNKGKAREISALLSPYISIFPTAGDLGLDEPEETGATFAENAILKARAAALASGKPALADDSGLCVNAINGDPGIYSARWGGEAKDFDLAMQKVNDALIGFQDRSAYFICVLAIAWPDGHVETFEGRVHGEIVNPARGDQGFGYDPIFQPKGHEVTFGEMDQGKKHDMSHRANAFKLLVYGCLKG